MSQLGEVADVVRISLAGRITLLFCIGLPSLAIPGLNPILPAIEAHFIRVPNAGILARLLVTAVGVTIAVTAPLAGNLADRFGYRRVFLSGLLVYGVAGSAGFFLDNLYQILASRIIFAVASATVGATLFAIIATRTEGDARNRWIGYVTTAGALSVAVALPLVGLIAHQQWQLVFLVHAAAFPLFVLALLALEPDPPRDGVVASIDRPRFQVPWGFLASAIAAGVFSMAPLLYIPFHMRDIGVGDPGRIGLAMLPLTVFSAAAAYSYGAVRMRLSLTAVFALSFALIASGVFGNAIAQNYTAVLLSLSVMGIGSGLVVVNTYALGAATGADAERAQMMGFAKGGMCAGPMVGQILLEPIVKHTNAAAALMVLAALAGALMLKHVWRMRAGRLAPFRF